MLRYQEIKQMLHERILGMDVGSKLPSRPELSRLLDSSRATVDKAIRELTEEGLLTSRFGSGTYVARRIEGVVEKSDNWCVIIPDIRETIYASLTSAIEAYANALHTNVIICNSDGDGDKQIQYIQRMVHSGISGFIIVPVVASRITENYRLYSSLLDSKLPFVFCNRSIEGIKVPIVTSNDFYGGYIATKHLLDQGYREIAYVAGERYSTSINRCQGYLSALMERGLPVQRHRMLFMPEPFYHDWQMIYDKTTGLLHRDREIDAVFAFSDEIALQVHLAASDAGLSMPGDIGIIGYNDTEACMRVRPALSSVAYMATEIGEMAAKLLQKQIDGQLDDEFAYYLFQPEIRARGSSNKSAANIQTRQ